MCCHRSRSRIKDYIFFAPVVTVPLLKEPTVHGLIHTPQPRLSLVRLVTFLHIGAETSKAEVFMAPAGHGKSRASFKSSLRARSFLLSNLSRKFQTPPCRKTHYRDIPSSPLCTPRAKSALASQYRTHQV